MAYPNPPRTWVAGAVATAAQFNSDLRDALNIIIPVASTTLAWGSYTPTLTQSATVTKTVTYAKYFQVGKIVVVVWDLAVTGAGTANNAVLVGLPVTAASAATKPVGGGMINDASVPTNITGLPYLNSTTTFGYLDTTAAANVVLGQTGAAFAAALASPDAVRGFAIYEAA